MIYKPLAPGLKVCDETAIQKDLQAMLDAYQRMGDMLYDIAQHYSLSQEMSRFVWGATVDAWRAGR